MMMEHREDGRADRRGANAPARTIRTVWDAQIGREWRVWCADCRDVPGARSDECLIFDGGTTVRRVWSPPPNWHDRSDAELLALVEPRPDR